ncbi:putative ATP-dependent RNA helicase DDX46 [Apostichopus japonicus]|uniref:Probable ATP-dependent RNA helicase DDX46 n=1 Tax=Stichopus japonicus TaxID=307972 RepID=A0A2G8L9E0_STIJA|nr:putative ATP-dependent RNA helicase DDX46 [Apostichopus japonicus]
MLTSPGAKETGRRDAEEEREDREMETREEEAAEAAAAAEETIVTENAQEEQKKKWTLEDDDEDDNEDVEVEEEEEVKEEKMEDESEDKGAEADDEKEEEDGVDPLDAFMKGVTDEVQKIKAGDRERLGLRGGIVKAPATQPKSEPSEPSIGKLSVLTGVAKKQSSKGSRQSKQKGELMENDQDAMEWSSEEEQQGNLMDAVAALEQKKKKDLMAVDHSTITYKPFKKDFYVEVPELARMTLEEVDKRRSDMEGIHVRGKDCPKPVESWVQCGVSHRVLTVLKKNKYAKPTPIQSQAIPAVMSGRDMIGIAKTGSGKTLAFLIPMFRHIMDQDPLEQEDGPIALIMAPTRELAMQIYKECRKFSKPLGLQVVCVYGGTGISEQIAELKKGAEIIVCTPGRMIDMLAANNGRVTNLLRCTYLVLDEADRMFDMGFEPQVMKIVDNVRPDRQTVLFSATFPRQMEALARKILTKPIEVQVGGRSVVCSDVSQHALIIEEEKKFLKLLELLGIYHEKGCVLIFVERQESADLLLRDLLKASYPCLALHGGIDQYDRDSIIQDFKCGNVKVLVATSVAARGLDVKQLILVVNYDCPNHYEDYVHRVGRTGRAGNKGFCYTFIQPDQQRFAGDVIKAFELSELKAPEEIVQMWAEFTEQQKADGKKVFTNSGFSGKGFRFDETEKELANAKKKLQKAALGLQDSDDDEAGMNLVSVKRFRIKTFYHMGRQWGSPIATNRGRCCIAPI